MKIFLTGNKGAGKSTCINEIIKECVISVCGFQTLPFCEHGVRKGFYLHSLIEVAHNDQQFSIQHETSNETIPNVFNTFGVEVLEKSMQYPNRTLILDEIGYLEHNEVAYLQTLQKAIDKFEHILGVLRKCDIKYIVEIKNRKDVLLLDFDQMRYDEIKSSIKRAMEEQQ